MFGEKSLFASKTFWLGILIAVSQTLEIFGITGKTISDTEAVELLAMIEEAWASIIAILAGLGVVWTRHTATDKTVL